MVVLISECQPNGRVWRHCSRSKNKKIALKNAIRRFFGTGYFLYSNEFASKRYGRIVRRSEKDANSLLIAVDKVRVTVI